MCTAMCISDHEVRKRRKLALHCPALAMALLCPAKAPNNRTSHLLGKSSGNLPHMAPWGWHAVAHPCLCPRVIRPAHTLPCWLQARWSLMIGETRQMLGPHCQGNYQVDAAAPAEWGSPLKKEKPWSQGIHWKCASCNPRYSPAALAPQESSLGAVQGSPPAWWWKMPLPSPPPFSSSQIFFGICWGKKRRPNEKWQCIRRDSGKLSFLPSEIGLVAVHGISLPPYCRKCQILESPVPAHWHGPITKERIWNLSNSRIYNAYMDPESNKGKLNHRMMQSLQKF